MISYIEFKQLNKENKTNGLPKCRIVSVDLKNDLCSLLVDGADNISRYNIQNLAQFVEWKSIGYIANPSAIQRWRKWSDKFHF